MRYIAVVAIMMSSLFSLVHAQAIHTQGSLTPQARSLFSLLGQADIATLDQANEWSQKHLLRRGERWDAQTHSSLADLIKQNSQKLMHHLKELGLIGTELPKQKEYDYALVMGGLKEGMQIRLDRLAALLSQGYRFGKVILLAGERPLRDEEKDTQAGYTTEAQLLEHQYKAMPSLKNGAYLLVNAPMKPQANGTLARPTTDDTLITFIGHKQPIGQCLVISNDPFTLRQTLVARRLLSPAGYHVQGAGDGKLHYDDILTLMDEFARTLYELKQNNS